MAHNALNADAVWLRRFGAGGDFVDGSGRWFSQMSLRHASLPVAVLAFAACAILLLPAAVPLKPASLGPASSAQMDVRSMRAEPTDDGIVPGVLGEAGAIDMADADGVFVVELLLHGMLDASVPGPEGAPVAYAVEFTTGHNVAGLTYRLAYDYSTGVFTLPAVEQGDRFLLYSHSQPNPTNPGLVSYCPIPADLSASSYAFDADTGTGHVTWRIALAEFNVDGKPAQAACPAEGAGIRGGRGLETGDVLTGVIGAATAKAVTVTLGDFQDTVEGDDYTVVGVGDPCADDATPPVLSAVSASAGATTATITWTTNEVSDSIVSYGPTDSYGSSASTPGGTTSHSVALSGLVAGTTYHFSVASTDGCGNTASSADASFTTDTGTGGGETVAFVTIESPVDGATLDNPATLAVSGVAGHRGVVGDVNGDGFVVIAIPDTGINPYHADFAASTYPRNTDADPDNDVDFSADPSTWLAGYPSGTPALDLTINGAYNAAADSAKFAGVAMNTMYRIPGTKIIGAVDTSNVAPINGGADNVHILDEGGHGTASASVAAGNLYGSCKECLLVVVEGLSGDSWAFQQDWIDIVSVSGGSLANIPTTIGIEAGHLPTKPGQRVAAERGQALLYAGGNGCLAYICPEQTYLSENTGPDWTMTVGALVRDDAGGHRSILLSGKPVDISSFAAGAIPAACHNNAAGQCSHSGTSAATPRTAGHMGDVLLAARGALGDLGRSGQVPSPGAGVLARGDPVPASPYLDDGVLTRAELWHVVLQSAEPIPDTGTFSIGIPTAAPGSPVSYLYAGYGVADDAMEARAIRVLLGQEPTPTRPDEDQFFALDAEVRNTLWGTWDDDADTVATSSPPPFTLADLPVTASQVALDPDVLLAAFAALDLPAPTVASAATGPSCTGPAGASVLVELLDGSTILAQDLVALAQPDGACNDGWSTTFDVAAVAAGDYTVRATYDDGSGASDPPVDEVSVAVARTPVLQSGVPVEVDVAADEQHHFTIDVPAGASLLRTEMTGPPCEIPELQCSFDVDLYVRHGEAPTEQDYDCRPFLAGNDETCDQEAPAAGTWYVMLLGYSGSGTVNLVATIDPAQEPDQGDGLDRDGDGIPNTVEEVLGMDPDEPMGMPTLQPVTVCVPTSNVRTADLDQDHLDAVYTYGEGATVTLHPDGSVSEGTWSGRCWLAGDPDDDGASRAPTGPQGLPGATVCLPTPKVRDHDYDGDHIPALYTHGSGTSVTISNGAVSLGTWSGPCWLAGDPDDDGVQRPPVLADVPRADGLVAGIEVGLVGSVAGGDAWDGSDVTVTARAFQRTAAGNYAPYTGPLDLVVQRDCGSLEPALATALPCQGAGESVGGLIGPVAQSRNVYTFTVPAAAMQDAFAGAPVTALHVFVQAPGQDSHFNQAKEALVTAAVRGHAPDLLGQADAAEAGTFTPIVVADASLPAAPAAGAPLPVDAGWFDRVGLGWLGRLL